MKLSLLFGKTKKEISSEEVAKNAQLLSRAGFISKEMAGVYSYLVLGYRVLRKIEQIVREEMEDIGGQEILMPALQPKENWQKTGRWQDFEALYKVKSRFGLDFALGPTHEEIVVPLAKRFIKSYKDLPLYLFQIQTKFRGEPRAKSGLLRGREFSMKDLYSFHKDEKDLDHYYEKVKTAYLKIFQRLGLTTLIVEASGGSFSQYSHEFQVLNEAGEDTVFYCVCGWAQNKEVSKKKEGEKCPKCGKKIKSSKAIEVGNIFKLNTKYSKPFDLKFKDSDGEDKLIVMGCYGIGPSRIMGTIVEAHYDDKGLIWPESIAPYNIHLLAIDNGKHSVSKIAEKIYYDLQKVGKEVLYDDRDVSTGEKFADADLIGLPTRILVSEKTLAKGCVELKRRDSDKIKLIKIAQIAKI